MVVIHSAAASATDSMYI